MDKLQGTQHFPGGLHRQGAAALPGIFGGHAAQQPRQLCLQTGKVILCQQPAGKGFLRQRSEIIPGAQPVGVDPLSICQSVGFHHFFLSLRIKEQSFRACSAKFPLTGLSATSILQERPSCIAPPGNWTPDFAHTGYEPRTFFSPTRRFDRRFLFICFGKNAAHRRPKSSGRPPCRKCRGSCSRKQSFISSMQPRQGPSNARRICSSSQPSGRLSGSSARQS